MTKVLLPAAAIAGVLALGLVVVSALITVGIVDTLSSHPTLTAVGGSE